MGGGKPLVPKRPLPDSSNRREQRAVPRTEKVAVAFVLFIIALGLLLYLLA